MVFKTFKYQKGWYDLRIFYWRYIVDRVNTKDAFKARMNYTEKLFKNFIIKNFKCVKPQVSTALDGYK